VLPEVVLNLGERETVFVLVHSTDDDLWRETHTFETVRLDEGSPTPIATVQLLLAASIPTDTTPDNVRAGTIQTSNCHVHLTKKG